MKQPPGPNRFKANCGIEMYTFKRSILYTAYVGQLKQNLHFRHRVYGLLEATQTGNYHCSMVQIATVLEARPNPSGNVTAAARCDRFGCPAIAFLRKRVFPCAKGKWREDRVQQKFIPVCRVRVRAAMSRGKERRRTSRPPNLHIWLRGSYRGNWNCKIANWTCSRPDPPLFRPGLP